MGRMLVIPIFLLLPLQLTDDVLDVFPATPLTLFFVRECYGILGSTLGLPVAIRGRGGRLSGRYCAVERRSHLAPVPDPSGFGAALNIARDQGENHLILHQITALGNLIRQLPKKPVQVPPASDVDLSELSNGSTDLCTCEGFFVIGVKAEEKHATPDVRANHRSGRRCDRV